MTIVCGWKLSTHLEARLTSTSRHRRSADRTVAHTDKLARSGYLATPVRTGVQQ